VLFPLEGSPAFGELMIGVQDSDVSGGLGPWPQTLPSRYAAVMASAEAARCLATPAAELAAEARMGLASWFHLPPPGSGGTPAGRQQLCDGAGATPAVQQATHAALAEAAFSYCEGDFEGAFSMRIER
jgi:hypothetical protein